MLTKSHITKIALEILRYRGVRCWRQNNVRAVRGRTFTGEKGLSDIIGWQIKTGLLCMTEVKTLTDKLSQDQIDLLTSLHQSGGLALIATEVKGKVEIVEFVEYIKAK